MFEKLGRTIYTNELIKSSRKIEHIVIHCDATKVSQHIEARDIHRWHKERGWAGIGYHYFIQDGGELEIGRDINKDGAHVLGHNKNTIAICISGGLDNDGEIKENSFTKDTIMVLDDMIRKIMCMYPDVPISGHRDFKGVKKACPCMDIAEFIEGIEC